MSRKPFHLTMTQAGLTACVMYLASVAKLPWLSLSGLAVLSVAAIAARVAPAQCSGLWKPGWAVALLAMGGAWTVRHQITDGGLCALLAGQMALIIFITANQPGAGKSSPNWNFLGIVWGFAGTLILLLVSYLDDLPGQFYLGVAASLFLLVLCRIWFRLGAAGIQAVNTLILLLVALPAADVFLRLKSLHDMSWESGRYYSYEGAKKNPAGYILWTRYYEEQWKRMMSQVMFYDPEYDSHSMWYLFRPGTQGYLFHSLVSINRKGFRGPEIPDEKGNTYRIVALGESTTFGCTLNREDRPWPEILEQMIRERLKPARPVQVINAGVPGATLPGNVRRLKKEILALKPDMIISYHGYNGFYMLAQDFPPLIAKPPPPYNSRPLRLLADLEYGLKLNRYKADLRPNPTSSGPRFIAPMESDYARTYRELIQIAQTNGIRLVLANYSMAVNSNSDPALIGFYVQTVPATADAIRANVAHSEIVRKLSIEHPEICFVDTQPDFDGRHEYFTDLIHFTQDGRQHMAETFFDGIKKTLEAELSSPDPTNPH